MPDAETDTETGRAFPTQDALCERCGYRLRGLAIDSNCPECGSPVVESSPVHRNRFVQTDFFPLLSYWAAAIKILLSPRRSFRSMTVSGRHSRALHCLSISAFLAGLIWMLIGHPALGQGRRPEIAVWLYACMAVYVLTYIEMLGVTAISRRRGWRIPFHVANRVCCYASVAWVPGAVLASVGARVLHQTCVGKPWFESVLGLVPVPWLFYAGLFMLSLMWFEILVWTAVGQVKFANAWPEPAIEPGRADNG